MILAAACGGAPDREEETEPAAPGAAPGAAPATALVDQPAAPVERAGATIHVDAPQSATDTRILMERARNLERDGFWEDAALTRAVALRGATAQGLESRARAKAYLEQIRLLLKLERNADAEATLLTLRQDPPALAAAGAEGALILDLLEGRILAALGERGAAGDAYGRYIDAGGAATPAARLARAAFLAASADFDAALEDYDAVALDPAATAFSVESALLEAGLLLESRERYDLARQRYQTLYEVSPWLPDDALALHRIGIVAFAQGDAAGGESAWLQLLAEFPAHWRAGEVYEELLARQIRIDSLTEGVLLYRQGRTEQARAVLQEALSDDAAPADQAVAQYYLASIAEDEGSDAEAIEAYLAAVNLDVEGALAPEALWWAGQLLEDQGQVGLAEVVYVRLHSAYPSADRGPSAGFRAGLVAYQERDFNEAEERFLALAGGQADLPEAQRAWLWTGKTQERAGDPAGASAAYETAMQLDPMSYYGLRAQALLAAEPLAPLLSEFTLADVAAPDLDQTEAWLRRIVGAESADATQQLAAGPLWRAGLDLHGAGMNQSAAESFRAHLTAAEDDPWLLYRSGQHLEGLGLIHLRLGAAERLLESLPAQQRVDAPAEILRWAYPRGWQSLARQEAQAHDVDELLLYALIRQESLFNPAAGSSAGALGLTQVIPPTAEEIAAALLDYGFESPLLFRPERSIRYGAYYLGRQLASFNGAPWLALAAYNGGPGNALRWANDDLSIDPDLYYERITFAETRLYLRRVLEAYAWYRFIYSSTTGPTLVSGQVGAAPEPVAGAG